MALPATLIHFNLDLSDVDRGVYETVELRVAQHPSETREHLCCRLLAYALEYGDALAFGRGVSTADEPALWAKDPTGHITHWIEIGAPSAERIHKAAKRADAVSVYTHRDLDTVAAALQAGTIHRGAEIPIIGVPPALVQALAATVERRNRWSVVHTEGNLYVTVGEGAPLEGRLARRQAAV